MLKVFKFGGASVKNAQAIINIKTILQASHYEKLLIVVSAMGKTTNALENLLQKARLQSGDLDVIFEQLKQFHFSICNELFEARPLGLEQQLNQIFDHLYQKLTSAADQLSYNEHYDQTVSDGELMATAILGYYLKSEGFELNIIDARDYLITDAVFRSASVDWSATAEKIAILRPSFDRTPITLTQGFIGSTMDKRTTTLGREGSDFTAAVFAYCLDASELVVWKDVPGLLNADPKRFSSPIKIDQISYQEAVELAFYGATIIHPKTIKPLQNKNIPLKIQSFINPNEPCTLISKSAEFDSKIPSFIVKENQVLISIIPRDFSFMNEQKLHLIFGIFDSLHIRTHLLQTSAMSVSVCIDDDTVHLNRLLELLKNEFAVKYNSHLELHTIRHFTAEIAENAIRNREILLEQRSRTTLQLVLKKQFLQQ